MSDAQTIAVYSARVDDYAKFAEDTPSQSLRGFIEAAPEGGRVLDLGCGPGNAARFMAEAGLDAHAWDLTPEMVEMAATPGVTARQAGFDDLDEVATYDGVWANFSLLHAAKADMPRHLAAIATALKDAGVFSIGMKTGEGERRDTIGRFYSYYTRDELMGLLGEAGFEAVWDKTGEEAGLDGTVAPFILIRCVKRG
ncbi:MAG: class I SAM-dependent methyltransferase [Pseudomonadota bacterium]